MEDTLKSAALELIRAARGSRSQVAFSRRLGYRSNVAAEWESGRRAPTAKEWVRACTIGGLSVRQAITEFHRRTAHLWKDDETVNAESRRVSGETTMIVPTGLLLLWS